MARENFQFRANTVSSKVGRGAAKRRAAREAHSQEQAAFYAAQDEARYQEDKKLLDVHYDTMPEAESADDRRRRMKREAAARRRAEKKAETAA